MAEANAEWDLELGSWPSLEAQVAAIADDIAYDNHDIDDGLRAGLLDLDELLELPLVARLWDAIGERHPGHSDREAAARAGPRHDRDDGRRRARRNRAAGRAKPASRRSTMCARAGRPLAGFSDALAAEERELKRFLYARLYDLPRAASRCASEAERVVANLAAAYRADPSLLPPAWQRRRRPRSSSCAPSATSSPA